MRYILPLFLLTSIIACTAPPETPTATGPTPEEIKKQKRADHKAFHAALRKHTGAVASRDIETLESVMAPDGVMHLIRPSTEVVYTTDKYLKYHRSWFQDTTWTLKSTITDSKVGDDMGMAITEVMYEVPKKDGKPYWNKMIITYVLEKQDGEWYVVLDHSGSVKKSTDVKG